MSCSVIARHLTLLKHGFLAGNNVYYVGGRLAWDTEHETIGLTHPFHHDLR